MIRFFTRVRTAFAAAILSVAAAYPAAHADTTVASDSAAISTSDTGAELGEIVVTAQKRSESLQKVPMAITAVTSAELQQSGIQDLQGAVALVPNLNLGQQLGMAKIALRGIGLENISAGAEGSIAFNVDGVFISRSIAALSSFYDVQQLEVLRGPQGTLYGRNATGGAVNIITRDPTPDLSGYFALTGGNYDRVQAEGAVSGPIVPGVLEARVAFQTQDRDGYGKNEFTGDDIDNLHTRAIRGTLLFTPTDRLAINLKADYFREQDNAGAYHTFGPAGFSAPGVQVPLTGFSLGGTLPADIRDTNNPTDPRNHVEFWGVSQKIAYDLVGDTQFSSLTAYRKLNYQTDTYLDPTSAGVAGEHQSERDDQFSEELQLFGKSTRLTWLLGLYYFHEMDNGFQFTPFNTVAIGFPAPGTFVKGYLAGGYITTDALAGFGQASYEIVDNLRLTLGARYSSEKKTDHDEFAFPFLVADSSSPYVNSTDYPTSPLTADRSKRWPSFTPRVALDYQVTPDVLLYTSWARGFKSGTYNLGGLEPPVNPETVSALEAGVKSTFFDRRLRLNLAGFYYDYKDLQVGKVVQAQLALENAAAARIYGLESELTAQLTSRFDVDANVAWLHARFTDYYSADPARPYGDGHTFVDAAGNYLPGATAATPGAVPAFNLAGNSLSQAPNFTAFMGANYHFPTRIGTMTPRGEASYRDRVYFTPFNLDYVSQAANIKYNAFLNWDSLDAHWNGSLFVKNLTNKTIVGNSLVSWVGVGFPTNGYLEDPRTYGLRIRYNF
jgi:iron complex outermembrane receptor protein